MVTDQQIIAKAQARVTENADFAPGLTGEARRAFLAGAETGIGVVIAALRIAKVFRPVDTFPNGKLVIQYQAGQ